MAVFAHIADEAQSDDGRAGVSDDARRAPRRTLRFLASGSLASGEATNVIVHNVSATGLLLESRLALAEGETIVIDMPQAGPVPARVIWQSGALTGCRFDAPVSAAALSAAQLRGAIDHEVEIEAAPVPRPDSAESFGARLRRLRQERKLTLDQVALQLGVSKPTVWAWEQDKARPVGSRLSELASVLGAPLGEIQSTYDAPPIADLIAKARRQIAAAAGVAPARVRIMVEL